MKNKKTQPITLPYIGGCYLATPEQAAQLFTPAEISAGECRMDFTCVGAWQVLSRLKGWLTTTEETLISGAASPCLTSCPVSITFHSKRTIAPVQPNGYGITGHLKFKGKSTRVIDVSPLVQIGSDAKGKGPLVSVSCLHACIG